MSALDPVDKMEVGSTLNFSSDLDYVLAGLVLMDLGSMDLGSMGPLPKYPGFQIQQELQLSIRFCALQLDTD